MPVLTLPDDTALPQGVDAFVFEQDTEFILRIDLPVRYPKESAAALLQAATRPAARVPGTVHSLDGPPLLLMAVVHDLALDPSWREAWVAECYREVARVARERGLRELVLPLLGTVHGRLDRARSRALLEDAMRAQAIDPRLWLR